jgi:hypothetical protein
MLTAGGDVYDECWLISDCFTTKVYITPGERPVIVNDQLVFPLHCTEYGFGQPEYTLFFTGVALP